MRRSQSRCRICAGRYGFGSESGLLIFIPQGPWMVTFVQLLKRTSFQAITRPCRYLDVRWLCMPTPWDQARPLCL